ncbi:hypothetical protein Bca101_043479 [Brassica carinata]
MWINEVGVVGIYRRQQQIRFKLVAARVSFRMAPDACVAAPRAPHGCQHVQDSCKAPHYLPYVKMNVWSSCKAPLQIHMAISMLQSQVERHLVLLCVTAHAVIVWASTPSASLATYHARQLTPRPAQ